jgi:TRAP-type transport system periplasmic protein
VAFDMAEVFVALTQRTVDGLDIPLDSINVRKLYTVIKHVAMTNHVLTVGPLMGSKRKIEALPPALQRMVKEEGRAIVPFWRSRAARQDAPGIQALKQNGVAFTEVQYPAFRKAMDPVYAQFQSKIGGDLLERIIRIAGAA